MIPLSSPRCSIQSRTILTQKQYDKIEINPTEQNNLIKLNNQAMINLNLTCLGSANHVSQYQRGNVAFYTSPIQTFSAAAAVAVDAAADFGL